MTRKGYPDEDVLRLWCEIELSLASGNAVATACRSSGVSDAPYDNWRRRFGGMGTSQLSEWIPSDLRASAGLRLADEP